MVQAAKYAFSTMHQNFNGTADGLRPPRNQSVTARNRSVTAA